MLDSNILVDHLRSRVKETTVTRLQERAQLATTTVNLFELYLGAYKTRDPRRNLTGVKGLISTLQVLPLTEAAAERAGEILADFESKGQPIDARDLFVGAIALEGGFAVLTQNLAHFERIPGLQVISEEQVLSDKVDPDDPFFTRRPAASRTGKKERTSEEHDKYLYGETHRSS